MAIIYVVQPNAFLTIGILSQYFYFFAALYHVVPCITAVKQTIIRAIKKSRPKENEFFFKLTFSCSTSNSKSNTFVTGLP